MRNPIFSISVVTVFLIVYTIIANAGNHFNWAMVMFLLSPILVIWMVYTVLRYGKPSGKNFDQDFYDDVDYKRVPDND